MGDFYNVLTKGNEIAGLNITWIASGFILLAMGIFGIWSVLKESAFMVNLVKITINCFSRLHEEVFLSSTQPFCRSP